MNFFGDTSIWIGNGAGLKKNVGLPSPDDPTRKPANPKIFIDILAKKFFFSQKIEKKLLVCFLAHNIISMSLT